MGLSLQGRDTSHILQRKRQLPGGEARSSDDTEQQLNYKAWRSNLPLDCGMDE